MRVVVDGRKIADFGIGTTIRGLLEGLTGLDADLEIVVLTPPQLFDLVPADPRFRAVAENAPLYSLRELMVVGRHADDLKADVLHEPHYVVPFTRAAVVTTIHDLIHLHQPQRNPLARPYARLMLGRAVRRSARLLTVSNTVAGEIAALWPEAKDKLWVAGNAASSLFTPGPADPEVMRRHGVRGNDYFLFAGNDKAHKNLGTLLAAFAMARASGSRAHLMLTGGTHRQQEGVISSGLVTEHELLHLYRGAIALVQPSLEEGFGLPVVEAMASGCAVIISSIDSLREVSGGAALEVDAHDVIAMRDAIFTLENDSLKRAGMQQRGLIRAKNFSWKRCAEVTLRSWKEAKEKKKRGTSWNS